MRFSIFTCQLPKTVSSSESTIYPEQTLNRQIFSNPHNRSYVSGRTCIAAVILIRRKSERCSGRARFGHRAHEANFHVFYHSQDIASVSSASADIYLSSSSLQQPPGSSAKKRSRSGSVESQAPASKRLCPALGLFEAPTAVDKAQDDSTHIFSSNAGSARLSQFQKGEEKSKSMFALFGSLINTSFTALANSVSGPASAHSAASRLPLLDDHSISPPLVPVLSIQGEDTQLDLSNNHDLTVPSREQANTLADTVPIQSNLHSADLSMILLLRSSGLLLQLKMNSVLPLPPLLEPKFLELQCKTSHL